MKMLLNLSAYISVSLLLASCGGSSDDDLIDQLNPPKSDNDISLEDDNESPRVVSAGSISNNEIIVSFSEPMKGGVTNTENRVHYRIVGTGNNASELVVAKATLIAPDNRSVLLTTLSQSNVDYKLTVFNVTDLAGNVLEAPEVSLDGSNDPSTVFFTGIGPSGAEVVDSDNDGLSDSVEQKGWTVSITLTGGTTESIYVTSDPLNADTDNDGVPDAEEYHGGLSPRTSDTDGDTLSDDDEWNRIYSDGRNQDSDGDGIQDGFEYLFYKTSPILADTDGDQMSDPDELFSANRNPLIADLPSPDISVGNVNLQLDTRFTLTTAEGEVRSENTAHQTSLSQSEDKTFSTSNENSTVNTVINTNEISNTVSEEYSAGFSGTSASASATFGYSTTSTNSTEQGSEQGHTQQFGEESSQASEEAFHKSLESSLELQITDSLTRDVVGAAMKIDVTIDNAGDIPFTISNLELSAQTQDPTDRRSFIPIASLVPENPNLGGINIGAFGETSRGPFVFKTVDVFPHQIEELMKNPRGLLVRVANFDIENATGENFAFTSQKVLDRTVGITFDMGDGRTESYRVATASDHNPDTGAPSGITMERALQIAGLNRYPTIRDGGNGIVETVATGDDEQAASLNQAVEPRSTIIMVGDNQAIDTLVLGGDDTLVEADYETAPYAEKATIIDGGNGIVETVVSGDDKLTSRATVGPINTTVNPGETIVLVGLNGELDSSPGGDDILKHPAPDSQVLVRYKDVATPAYEYELDGAVTTPTEGYRFWMLFSSKSTSGVDFDDIVLRSGEQYDFTFIQDKDLDGLWAREEYLHSSSDSKANTDECDLNRPEIPCDTMSDFVEIREGWSVKLDTTPQPYQVYSNPVSGDSDRDDLYDDDERDCGLDPRLRDTDRDGLTDFEEIFGLRRLTDGTAYAHMLSRDPNTNAPVHTIEAYRGANSIIINEASTALVEHDSEALINCFPTLPVDVAAQVPGYVVVDGYATNPLNPDTDGDLVSDALELEYGLHPNYAADGPAFLDDDKDGLPNKVETDGYPIVVYDAITAQPRTITVTSHPNKVDTDDDGLPDLLEYYLRSNPQQIDTDGDGITDANEYRSNGDTVVTADYAPGSSPGATDRAVVLTRLADVTSSGLTYISYLNRCEISEACDHDLMESQLRDAGTRQLGTSLNSWDTDLDGRTDSEELATLEMTVNGALVVVSTPHNPRTGSSDPLVPDTDNDGLNDGYEVFDSPREAGQGITSNPLVVDTDADGESDTYERSLHFDGNGNNNRNPRVADLYVNMYLDQGRIGVTENTGWSPSSFSHSFIRTVAGNVGTVINQRGMPTSGDGGTKYYTMNSSIASRNLGTPWTFYDGVIHDNQAYAIHWLTNWITHGINGAVQHQADIIYYPFSHWLGDSYALGQTHILTFFTSTHHGGNWSVSEPPRVGMFLQ